MESQNKPLNSMNSLLEAMTSPNAPQSIGPYSQAIRTSNLLFCSGQIGLDPKSGEIQNSSIETETRQVLRNLFEVLNEGGATFAHVVKTTIFLTNLSDFDEVNAIYEEEIGSARPARSTVEVSALPKGARVEIDCIAVLA